MPHSLDAAERGLRDDGRPVGSVFISHSSRDNDVAGRVRQTLQAAGFASVFLDFDPETGIPPGRRWEDELYSALRKADTVVFLSTAASVESKWCHAELALARALGRTILPVLLEAGAIHPLLEDTQWVRAEGLGDDELGGSSKGHSRAFARDPRSEMPWNTSISPYPGLHAFDENRAGVFYGRDAEVADVVRQVTWPHAVGGERLVLIVGPSGCGKSSLVRAGVVPRLRKLEGPWVIVPPFSPGERRVRPPRGAAAKARSARPASRRRRRCCCERVRDGELSAIVRELCRAKSVD